MSFHPNPFNNNNQDAVKRQRTRGNGLADSLICPISLELPFLPVMAEDGRVYEKEAIARHIALSSSNGGILRSPYTNQPMGPRLVDSHQIKGLIETSIQNGSITGELAATWLAKQAGKHQIAKWKKQAANYRHREAASNLAVAYYKGTYGVKKCLSTAMKWFKVASDFGDVLGMTMYGWYLVRDESSDKAQGAVLLTEAAGKGSSSACLLLGKLYCEGNNVVPTNYGKAVQWLERGLNDDACQTLALELPAMEKKYCEEVCLYNAKKMAKKKVSFELPGIDPDFASHYMYNHMEHS